MDGSATIENSDPIYVTERSSRTVVLDWLQSSESKSYRIALSMKSEEMEIELLHV